MRFEIELPNGYDDALSITAIGTKGLVTNVKQVTGHDGDLLIVAENKSPKWVKKEEVK